MSFVWTRYLALARELAGKPVTTESREAKLRSAISRAYYAAFHEARDYLQTMQGRLPYNVNEHEYVKNWYIDQGEQQGDRLHKQIGNDLDRMRQDRNRADYTDEWYGGLGALDKTAEMTLTVAARTIENIGRLTGR